MRPRGRRWWSGGRPARCWPPIATAYRPGWRPSRRPPSRLFETAPAGHQFFIDAASVNIGSDGVVRYTLMMKTAGGAVNVSFEGIRCETREQKYYAFGQAGGGWTRARDPAWRPILVRQHTRHLSLLHSDYFCEGRDTVKTARAAVDALRYGSNHPRYKIQ